MIKVHKHEKNAYHCLNNKYWHFDNDIYDHNNFKE